MYQKKIGLIEHSFLFSRSMTEPDIFFNIWRMFNLMWHHVSAKPMLEREKKIFHTQKSKKPKNYSSSFFFLVFVIVDGSGKRIYEIR